MTTVSVIGCAGRNQDASRMTAQLYGRMVKKCEQTILEMKLEPRDVRLVSGGAAWSDHVAVTLFLSGKYGGLTLHLPCEWHSSSCSFVTNESSHWAQNPGKIANLLHVQFTEKLGRDTLAELETARRAGATFVVHKGFHKRNDQVARSRYLIAFSWSPSDSPPSGGTRYTWDKATGRRIRVSLCDL
jgi:hypothetical protein